MFDVSENPDSSVFLTAAPSAVTSSESETHLLVAVYPNQEPNLRDSLYHFEEYVRDNHIDRREGHPGRQNSICNDPET